MTQDRDPRTPQPGNDSSSGESHAADRVLDAAIRGAARGPSPDESAAAQERAWSRLLEAAKQPHDAAKQPHDAVSPHAAGCIAIMAELPGLLSGQVAGSRADLLADHCRECLSCRRELLRLRDAHLPEAPSAAAPSRKAWRRFVAPMAAAATVTLAALITFSLVRDAGRDAPLRVARLDGQLLLDEGGASLSPGASVTAGRSVRTTKGSRAILELPDGSRVEMNERAELSLTEDGDALTVNLERGDIIVEAAKRRERNLFVRTDDCQVAVKGTVFTVGHGLKGSRVGVLEGEVHVDHGRDRRVLRPGDQVTTHPDLGDETLAEQVQWSLSNAQWASLAREIDSAAAQLEREQLPPAIRYESRILDAMPARTVFYTALPNGGSIARFTELISERVSSNPELAAWWKAEVAGPGADHPSISQILTHLGDLSSSIADEVVFAMIIPPGEVGAHPTPVLVAAVADEAQLRKTVGSLPRPGGSAGPVFRALSDVEKSVGAGSDEFMLVLHAGHVLAAPAGTALLQVAAGLDSPSASATPFLDSLHAQYRAGAEFLLAADLASLVDLSLQEHAVGTDDPFARLMGAVGLDGVERFIVTAGHRDDGSATLTFRDVRSGMASWLAEPGPMGSLDFVRPEAPFVSVALFRDPKIMLGDLAARLGSAGPSEEIERFRKETGVDLLEDVAGPLGGEMAFAIDGPLLPTPSWKLILEVYDPPRLDSAIDRLVERAAAWERERSAASGEPLRIFSVTAETLTTGPARVLDLGGFGLHYAYRDGYLIACPSRPLLEAALQARAAGSLAGSAKLASLLPQGSDHVSLLAYQDLGSALGELAGAIPVGDAFPAEAHALATAGPMLVHARASERAITLGLGSSAGGASSHLASVLRHAMVQSLARRATVGAVGYDGATAAPAAPQGN